MSKENAVAVVEAEVLTLTDKAVQFALDNKATIEEIEKLLTLKERFDKAEALKAYNKAMSQFKANPPAIKKDKKVGYKPKDGGRDVSYSHASLYNVTESINKELSKYGLSASWSTKQNGTISVTCRITHVKGHSEETTLSAPADQSGAKNAIQAIGSTITYLERYSLLALTGLATYDMDDDGKGAGKPEVNMPQEKKPEPTQKKESLEVKKEFLITDAQGKRLFAIARGSGYKDADIKDYLVKKYGVDSSKAISRDWYEDIIEHFKVVKNG